MSRIDFCPWSQTRDRFRHVVFQRGLERVAGEIPADRATVYRLITGRTNRPTLAIRVRIEELIKAQDSKESPQ